MCFARTFGYLEEIAADCRECAAGRVLSSGPGVYKRDTVIACKTATPSNVCTFNLEKLQWCATARGKEKALADEFLSTPIERSPNAELFNKVKREVGV